MSAFLFLKKAIDKKKIVCYHIRVVVGGKHPHIFACG